MMALLGTESSDVKTESFDRMEASTFLINTSCVSGPGVCGYLMDKVRADKGAVAKGSDLLMHC